MQLFQRLGNKFASSVWEAALPGPADAESHQLGADSFGADPFSADSDEETGAVVLERVRAGAAGSGMLTGRQAAAWWLLDRGVARLRRRGRAPWAAGLWLRRRSNAPAHTRGWTWPLVPSFVLLQMAATVATGC